MALGYTINRNLNESDTSFKDASTLDNLGGDFTSDVIQLFTGNSTNTSELKGIRTSLITDIEVTNTSDSNSIGSLTFICENDFIPGQIVNISGVTPIDFNVERRIAQADASSFTIFFNVSESFPSYVSGGVAETTDYTIEFNERLDENAITLRSREFIPFSNGTRLYHGEDKETFYTVINSDGKTSFQLIDDQNQKFFPTLTLYRSDFVSIDDIKFLSPEIINPVILPFGSLDVAPGINRTSLSSLREISLSTSRQAAENAKNEFEVARSQIIQTNALNRLSNDAKFDSNISIKNDEFGSDPTKNNAPGLFIYDGTTFTRAFSNNENPWKETVVGSGYTTSTEPVTSVRELTISNPNISGLSIESVNLTTTFSVFSHKVPVTIQVPGDIPETYYLLCVKK